MKFPLILLLFVSCQLFASLKPLLGHLEDGGCGMYGINEITNTLLKRNPFLARLTNPISSYSCLATILSSRVVVISGKCLYSYSGDSIVNAFVNSYLQPDITIQVQNFEYLYDQKYNMTAGLAILSEPFQHKKLLELPLNPMCVSDGFPEDINNKVVFSFRDNYKVQLTGSSCPDAGEQLCAQDYSSKGLEEGAPLMKFVKERYHLELIGLHTKMCTGEQCESGPLYSFTPITPMFVDSIRKILAAYP